MCPTPSTSELILGFFDITLEEVAVASPDKVCHNYPMIYFSILQQTDYNCVINKLQEIPVNVATLGAVRGGDRTVCRRVSG